MLDLEKRQPSNGEFFKNQNIFLKAKEGKLTQDIVRSGNQKNDL